MGLLDNNNVRTTPRTGLEGSPFKKIAELSGFDVFQWDSANTGKDLKMTYKDVYAWVDSSKLYLVKGNITDIPIEVAVNSTNFPGLRANSGGANPKITKVIACPGKWVYQQNGQSYGNVSSIGGSLRICVIFDNGQIYHNYPSCNDTCDFYNGKWRKSDTSAGEVKDLFDKFAESVVWDLPGRKNPVKTTTGSDATLISTGAYYYNPALPDSCYEMHPAISQANGYGNTVGFPATNNVNPASSGDDIGVRARFWRPDMDNPNRNSFTYMGGYVTDSLFTMIGTYIGNVGTESARICVFGSQDCGRSWYCMYEFAGRERVKTDDTYMASEAMRGVVLSQSGSANSGIYSVKRRALIMPTATTKEPAHKFEFDSPIDIASIDGTATEITFTTSSSHGLDNGDVIAVNFQSEVTADGRTFDWMVNSSVDADSGGNGIFLQVYDKTSTTFKVALYIHNTETNLPVRHIHALNRCKDGVSVSCGEDYSLKGGWVLYNPVISADTFGGYNVAKASMNAFVRLNSTPNSFQRPLGTIIQEEGDDTYCYVGMDTANAPMNDVTMPDGRTQSFKHNSCGVWKSPLSGFDSMKDNAVLKYPATQTCFGLQKILGVMIFTGQSGNIAASFDNGESWESISLPDNNSGQSLCHFSGPTYDRRFSVDNVLVQLKK